MWQPYARPFIYPDPVPPPSRQPVDESWFAVLAAAGEAIKKAQITPMTRTCTIIFDITVTRFLIDFTFDGKLNSFLTK
jgi:hypothetical protein